MRASLSSSDMSGLKTIIVSYCLNPGGHCGSSLSSIAVAVPTDPGGTDVGSSSEPNPPPSKNEPEKSMVCALTVRETELLFFLCKRRDFAFVRKVLRLRAKEKRGEEGS